MRGYHREEVDAALQNLRREVIKANSDKAEATKEIKRLTATVADLQAELDETGSPTYSGLGMKLENTLRVAEEQSTRLISQADIDAEKLRSTVQAEVTALREEVAVHAETILAEATAKADATLAAAQEEAAELIAAANSQAELTTQDALREA